MKSQWTGIQALRRRPRDVAGAAPSSDEAGTVSRGAARPSHDTSASTAPLPPPCTPLHLNLLLVGRQGVGKTTFVLNACARWGMAPKDIPINEAAGTSVHIFETQPDSMACSVPEILLGPEASHAVGQTATTEELQQQRALRIRLQDTPGYGERGCRGPEDPSRHLPAVLRWVLHQRHRDVAALNGAALSVADGGRRLGLLPYSPCLCLVMLDPSRFTELDVEYLSALSRVVGVLPVLARADTLTAHERQQMRERVAAAMAEHTNVKGLAEPVSTYRFSAQALDAMGRPALPTPHILSFLGSGEMVEENPAKPQKQQQQQRQRTRQQQHHQEQEVIQQEDSEEKGQQSVLVSSPSSSSGSPSSSPPAAATSGRWVAVRRLGGDGSSAVLSAADPSLSDTELLLGLLRADLWGVAADARDRHIEFASRYKAVRSRLPPLERDLLRHVAWHRLGGARPRGAAAAAMPPAGTIPWDPYGSAYSPPYSSSGILSPALAGWVAMLGLAAAALFVWARMQERQAGAQLALVSQQQEAYREALHSMQGVVEWLKETVQERDARIWQLQGELQHAEREVRYVYRDTGGGCTIC